MEKNIHTYIASPFIVEVTNRAEKRLVLSRRVIHNNFARIDRCRSSSINPLLLHSIRVFSEASDRVTRSKERRRSRLALRAAHVFY